MTLQSNDMIPKLVALFPIGAGIPKSRECSRPCSVQFVESVPIHFIETFCTHFSANSVLDQTVNVHVFFVAVPRYQRTFEQISTSIYKVNKFLWIFVPGSVV